MNDTTPDPRGRPDVIGGLRIPVEIRDDMVALIGLAPAAVWQRPAIPSAQRSMMSITMLAGLGRLDELRIHIGMGLDNGLSRAEICEVLMQAGIYAGFPAAISGLRIADEVFSARDDG